MQQRIKQTQAPPSRWVCSGGLTGPLAPTPKPAESARVHSRPEDVLRALGLKEYLLSSFSLLVLFHLLSREEIEVQKREFSQGHLAI